MCVVVRALGGVKHRVCSVSSSCRAKLGGWDGEGVISNPTTGEDDVLVPLCWAALIWTVEDH